MRRMENPATDFLFRATAHRFGDGESARELARSAERLNEPALARDLLRNASYHELEPLLHAVVVDCMRSGHDPGLPQDLLDAWEEASARESARTAVIQFGAAKALKALEEAGIGAIPLKGFYLAARCYERKSARGFRDLDLLVREEDLGGLHRSLLDAGFQPAPERPSFVPAPACTVYSLPLAESGMAMEIDIHVGMHWPAEYERRTSFRASDIWDEAVAERVEGMAFLAMRPEHLVITTLLDVAVNHRYARLVKFRDVIETLRSRDLDWNKLVEDTRRWGVRSFVAPGLLYLCRMDPSCPVPSGVVDSLLPSYAFMRAFLRALPAEALPSHRSRSFSPANLLFFLLADDRRERYRGLAYIPKHLLKGLHRF
ncbi:MAG: hypothetical protein HPY75_13725 [Actinobacteria bacterium]|nr:hypothetical protein [Actinomycetota bacterium]